MRIVTMSDTHMQHNFVVPPGDVVIHAGDALSFGTKSEFDVFIEWYTGLPHKKKIYVAGNHDLFVESHNQLARKKLLDAGIVYLQDNWISLNGISIYGAPWQPEFFDWAFNLPRGSKILAKWRLIPENMDVLITHGPPFGMLDAVPSGEKVGCKDLRNELKRIKPKYHVFGHIHHSYGREDVDGTTFINTAICNERYRPVQCPHIIDLEG